MVDHHDYQPQLRPAAPHPVPQPSLSLYPRQPLNGGYAPDVPAVATLFHQPPLLPPQLPQKTGNWSFPETYEPPAVHPTFPDTAAQFPVPALQYHHLAQPGFAETHPAAYAVADHPTDHSAYASRAGSTSSAVTSMTEPLQLLQLSHMAYNPPAGASPAGLAMQGLAPAMAHPFYQQPAHGDMLQHFAYHAAPVTLMPGFPIPPETLLPQLGVRSGVVPKRLRALLVTIRGKDNRVRLRPRLRLLIADLSTALNLTVEETVEVERYILNTLEHEVTNGRFKLGYCNWVRGIGIAERERYLESLHQITRHVYPAYDKRILEMIIGRGLYAYMQKRLRQERERRRKSLDDSV